jgi:hypothetical protein
LVRDPAGQLLEPLFDHIMIISALGIDGNGAAIWMVECIHRIVVGAIINA